MSELSKRVLLAIFLRPARTSRSAVCHYLIDNCSHAVLPSSIAVSLYPSRFYCWQVPTLLCRLVIHGPNKHLLLAINAGVHAETGQHFFLFLGTGQHFSGTVEGKSKKSIYRSFYAKTFKVQCNFHESKRLHIVQTECAQTHRRDINVRCLMVVLRWLKSWFLKLVTLSMRLHNGAGTGSRLTLNDHIGLIDFS